MHSMDVNDVNMFIQSYFSSAPIFSIILGPTASTAVNAYRPLNVPLRHARGSENKQCFLIFNDWFALTASGATGP